MPDDCGCGQRGPKKEALDRREFIKTTGLVAVGAALAATPLRINHPPGLPLTTVDTDTIKLALTIAGTDPMYQELDSEIQALGMKLDAVCDSVKFSDGLGSLVGIVIPHSSSPSKRMGVDIAITVDINTGILTSIQTLIGWSLVDMLNVSSIALDHRGALETVIGQNKNGTFTIQIRPRAESHLTFPYLNTPPISPLDLVDSGWPLHAEDPNAGYWHYENSVKADWLTVQSAAVYRVIQVKEANTLLGDRYTDLPFAST